MSSISDIIERYLKKILNESDSGVIEIKRSELADTFQCVPSQINYVISTRFTIEKGYIVESKRGGGGFIRIQKVRLKTPRDTFEDLLQKIGDHIPQITAEHVISRLLEENLMTPREALLMRRLVSRETLQLPIPLRDQMRARMMRMMITTIFTSKGE
ncbi:CtsR family transcriptional regulator [Paenactinomyces guangxiensis]|uniref:Transcriptional regulator CtsR n=1 Tax=Paenactinomyces guangxiensis TaxID=1490290 RepID=A0A7W1WTS5_9BACL|nr:CtsR family transcriptional regulator [Paenactinomyces guangxiensis]MBA4495853.1 CtsR family transcriptional regulator [Paenactinomyces guangxiensis]MBH8593010.1 CtsR family transcriptional regulator [Paenactinomyces guangxiensis]